MSLDVSRGSITALIGPNGAGKTTLFNLLTGFDAADTGTIELFGERVERLPAWRLARKGMVRSFQTPVGFPTLSVWENLMVAASSTSETLLRALAGRRSWKAGESATAQRVAVVLDRLGLADRKDAVLDDLSGGEVKLVDFGRQMLMRPRLLLLDEPAAGVHPTSINRLGEQIRSLRDDGISVVVIDHNMSFVFGVADYLYVLASGSVLAHGTPDEVASDPRVVELYLGSDS
ncbi:ATP-binding cassette domain-containing protein [Georgenia sp. 10Sc9-8]|uniref:ATP-binding cassette domain-containing protein n=1 Tax=Georgenia halotolerans TaxID=3028317 RepID=A0ABT5U4B8_9MICO|nr:ATP-binding cassette domain-containing protein [Georgenia halotolerans]